MAHTWATKYLVGRGPGRVLEGARLALTSSNTHTDKAGAMLVQQRALSRWDLFLHTVLSGAWHS